MVLQGDKPDHNYPSTQTELYAVCKIGLTSFRENLADFSNFKGYYDAAWGNLFEQEINDAQSLPSPQQRGEPSETANIQLKEKADECLTAWQRLKRHIIDAFPKNLHKPKLEAAGQTLYNKAGKDDWEVLQELMEDGEKFITQNLATLTANQNMPPAFQGQFTTVKNEFDTLYNTFTDAEQDAEGETTEKILANNAIHSKLMGMFKDGQEIELETKDSKSWSIDPEFKTMPGLNPYGFVANNPINAIDQDGARMIFVNGYWRADAIGQKMEATSGGQSYWSPSFAQAAQNFFGSTNTYNQFIDGRGSFNSTAANRYKAGQAYGRSNLKALTANLVKGETFKIVTHSHGGAYGAGLGQALIEEGYTVEYVVHLSAYQPTGFVTPQEPTTYQLGYGGDLFADVQTPIGGIDRFGVVQQFESFTDQIFASHGSTRNEAVFTALKNLRNAQYLGNTTINTLGTPGVDYTGVFIQGKDLFTNTGTTKFSTIVVKDKSLKLGSSSLSLTTTGSLFTK